MGHMKDFDMAMYSTVSDGVYSIIETYSLSCGELEKIEPIGADALEYFFKINSIKHSIERYNHNGFIHLVAAWQEKDGSLCCGSWYMDARR